MTQQTKTLYGADAIVSRVLDKVELAARRAADTARETDQRCKGLEEFIEELRKINAEIGT